MKGFGIYVKNDLLEPKHIQNMGEAVWLYMWLLDKITTVNENGEGKILGNKPIKFGEVSSELGISRFVYVKWVDRLRLHGYINTLRTPAGLIITLTKAKKGKSDVPKRNITMQRDVPKFVGDVAILDSDVPKRNIQYKTKQDKTMTKQIITSTGVDMFDFKIFFYELVTKLGFTDSVRFTDGRKLKLKARLKSYKPDELVKAAEYIGGDAFLQGDNPGGKRYGDIDYLLRSDEQIDKQLNKLNSKVNYKADW